MTAPVEPHGLIVVAGGGGTAVAGQWDFDAGNLAAIDAWLPARPGGRLLKTDLFDEVSATGTMLARTENRFRIKPSRLAADTAYGRRPDHALPL